jgi:DNA-binding MarR family transcriptional regulator
MKVTERDVVRLTRLVRLCFNRLKMLGDELHADLGISAALRAVLETLTEDGPRTVPRIAAAKSVSRQHIQKIADALIAAGHVETATNPAHRRSSFIAATAKGRKMFATMKTRERKIIAEIAAGLKERDVAGAIATLDGLSDLLATQINQIKEDDNDS